MLGTYRKHAAWLKTGAFVRFQAGMRHDDDWVRLPTGRWEWRDTSSRNETVLVFDVSPRAKLGWLPGSGWLGLFKTRYEHNTFNRQSTLKLQPELSWFWMKGLKPKAHFALRYEADLALNFGRQTLREQWVYGSALWHSPAGLLVGPTAALREGIFEASSNFSSFSGGATAPCSALRPGFTAAHRRPVPLPCRPDRYSQNRKQLFSLRIFSPKSIKIDFPIPKDGIETMPKVRKQRLPGHSRP